MNSPSYSSCIIINLLSLIKIRIQIHSMKSRSKTTNPVPSPTHKATKNKSKSPTLSSHKPKSIKNTLHNNNNQLPKNIKKENKLLSVSDDLRYQVKQDYFILNGNFYKASTDSERKQIDSYVNRFKRQAKYQKMDNFNSIKNTWLKDSGEKLQKIPRLKKEQERFWTHDEMEESPNQSKIQQLVRNLRVQQKITLMKQLQKQLSNNPQFLYKKRHEKHSMEQLSLEETKVNSKRRQQEENEQKYKILSRKLQSLEIELIDKRQSQIQKINALFDEGQLTSSQRKTKIVQIDKIKERKLKMINCTKKLFHTLLNNKLQAGYLKKSSIDQAMKDLGSLSQLQLDSINEQHFLHKKEQGESSIQSQVEFQKMYNDQHKMNIDICQKYQDFSDKKSINEDSLLISPDKSAEKDRQKDKIKQRVNEQEFRCSQQSVSISRKLHIPLLLTKQKMEQMEWQRKAKAVSRMRSQIDRKISFQMSQVQIQQINPHFTTLADVNNFIVGLYEHIIKKDLQPVVSRLNMPYGKATRDKLYLIQQNGQIDDIQYYSVLEDTHYSGFQNQITLNTRRLGEGERIHNKAVFDSFNSHLNAYRPYYDLEGDVYPWMVSEKGLTFYEINEQNIEQVFEKTKIKVLEECSILCGVIPYGIQISQSPQLVKQKNNQHFSKEEKLSLAQNFNKWAIKILDYDTMIRLLLSEEIIIKQVLDFIKQLKKIGK